jgi:hypothetical protein
MVIVSTFFGVLLALASVSRCAIEKGIEELASKYVETHDMEIKSFTSSRASLGKMEKKSFD